jgi:hypothetical protein
VNPPEPVVKGSGDSFEPLRQFPLARSFISTAGWQREKHNLWLQFSGLAPYTTSAARQLASSLSSLLARASLSGRERGGGGEKREFSLIHSLPDFDLPIGLLFSPSPWQRRVGVHFVIKKKANEERRQTREGTQIVVGMLIVHLSLVVVTESRVSS